MIALFRRHLASCKLKSRKKRNCRCPIWAEGKVHGKAIRKSLGLTDWEAAVRQTREWELHDPGTTKSMADAAVKFLGDAKARKLSEGTLLKYDQAMKSLKALDAKMVPQVTVEDLRTVREAWPIKALTMQKRLETIRAFFNFCMASGWTDKNPADAVKAPKVNPEPTMPFDDEAIAKIFEALDTKYLEEHPFSSELTKRKLKAFILVMLYSGVRISDCVFLRKSQIEDGRLFLYTHKTKVAVRVPLPKKVLAALDAIGAADFFFSSGNGKIKTWTTEWEERLKKVFVLAGFPEAHSHMLRDTFCVRLLSKGVPIETVAALLGNTVKVVEKHYNPWVKVRQEGLEESVRKTW